MKMFKKFATIIPIIIVSGTLFIGCKENEAINDSTWVQARISAGIQTRAIDTSWEKNDCIGLHIFKTGTNDFVYNSYNYQYFTPEGSSYFNANGDDIIYYPLDGSSIDFVGYYPYDATMTEACVCRADVSDQTTLSAIDLMTSERFTGANRSTPDVTIRFHHRLSKLIFRAFYQDKITELPIEKVVIKGMNTAASYNMLTETLTVDAGSGKTLEAVSRDNKKVEAIVLPRDPAEGVTFIITSAGHEFTAHLSEEQEFKSGFKYTFNLVLNDEHGSEPTIKAIIQDWVDGGEIDAESKLVTISNGPGEAIGFDPGDVIILYHEDMELTKFTYDGTDWSPETPIYWENIGDGVSEVITLRAMFQRVDALSGEQMPEVFLSETTTRRYESIYLHFNLAPAKIEVKLTSNSQDANETFSSEELAAATIQLPSYINEYDITNGIFTPGDGTGDIGLVDRQALIVPQTKSGILATITLNGNQYFVVQQEPQQFLAGKVYTITVNILKSQVNPAFYLSYTDWTPGDSIDDMDGTPVGLYLSGSTVNFGNGDMFTLYTGTEKLAEYTYDGSTWTGGNDVYWEEIGDGVSENVTFHAEFIRKNKLDDTQMDEIFLAAVTCQRFGKVTLDFKLVPAKVIVVLKSDSETEPNKRFTVEELKGATVLLDQYKTGGSFAYGVFTPGTTEVANIRAVDISGNETQKEALVQPQLKTGTLARITLLGNEYKIEHSTELDLQAGKVYTITVNMLKSTLNPSFDIGYTDWVDDSDIVKNATPVNLTVTTGITANFVYGDRINLYDVVRNAYLTTYEYEGDNKWKILSGAPALYWEDIGDGYSSQVKLRAEFIRTDKLNNTQLPELFLAEATCDRFGNLSFQFGLVPAKISFELKSNASEGSDTFTVEQLNTATITLPNYKTGYSLVNGAFTQTGATGNVIVADDRTALIIPQTKTGIIAKVTLLNVDYDITDESGIEFKAGEHTKIIVNVVKTNVTKFSASYTEWTDVPADPYDALKIVTGNVTTNNFDPGDRLSLYYTNTTSNKDFIAQFEYKGENKWDNINSSSTNHYWQNLNDQAKYDFYAVSTLKPAPGGSNQMDDVMYAECKGVDKLGAITLAFTKKTSKINVVLTSESDKGNTFTENELRSAAITLPGYEIGAKYNGIDYNDNGAATGDIKANTTTDTDGAPTWTALIEPQTINASNVAQTVLIRITIGGIDYELKRDTATAFAEANQYTYTINLLKTGITFTTSYSEWTNNNVDGGNIGLD